VFNFNLSTIFVQELDDNNSTGNNFKQGPVWTELQAGQCSWTSRSKQSADVPQRQPDSS